MDKKLMTRLLLCTSLALSSPITLAKEGGKNHKKVKYETKHSGNTKKKLATKQLNKKSTKIVGNKLARHTKQQKGKVKLAALTPVRQHKTTQAALPATTGKQPSHATRFNPTTNTTQSSWSLLAQTGLLMNGLSALMGSILALGGAYFMWFRGNSGSFRRKA